MAPNGSLNDPPSVSRIMPHLLLGNFTCLLDKETVKKYHIKCAVSLMCNPLYQWELPSFRELIPRHHHKFVKCNDNLDQDILQHLTDICDFIESERRNFEISYRQGRSQKHVLVHCRMGISRSATVVIAYMMRKCRISLDRALRRVKDERRIVNPNKNFLEQLRVWGDLNYQVWEDKERKIPKPAYQRILNKLKRREDDKWFIEHFGVPWIEDTAARYVVHL